MDPLLQVRNLSLTLPAGADREFAVRDLDLEVRAGQTVCVIGESGSGKSMTGRAILRLLPKPHVRIAAGEIVFGGRDLARADEAEIRRIRGRDISMVFQEPMTALNPVRTIGSQIEEVLRVHTQMPRAERRSRIVRILEEVNLADPERVLSSYPHQLSGGQRQRAMIAMALILEPKLLIADEPTTALDVTTQAQILRLIKTIQQTHGTGVLFITHDFGVVADIADRVVVMERGRMVEAGPARDVLRYPRQPYTRALMAAVPSLDPAPREPVPDIEPILKVSGLAKTYRLASRWIGPGRIVKAVDHVDLTLRSGETLGIVGESGSGKSSLAKLVLRLVPADEGRVEFRGEDLLGLKRGELRLRRHQIQVVFQDPYGSLNPRWKIGDIIAEGPRLVGMSRQEAREKALRLLDLVGLDRGAAHRYPHEFSGGQRQRIAIARALATDPKVLIADEAVSALDVSVQAQILALLAQVKADRGLAMMFITHDLRVAAQICDNIAVMKHGRVVEYATTREIFTAPREAYTRELFAAIPGHGLHARSEPECAPAGP